MANYVHVRNVHNISFNCDIMGILCNVMFSICLCLEKQVMEFKGGIAVSTLITVGNSWIDINLNICLQLVSRGKTSILIFLCYRNKSRCLELYLIKWASVSFHVVYNFIFFMFVFTESTNLWNQLLHKWKQHPWRSWLLNGVIWICFKRHTCQRLVTRWIHGCLTQSKTIWSDLLVQNIHGSV